MADDSKEIGFGGEAGFTTIRFERDGTVALIVLNRPEVLNAMSTRMHRELFQAIAIVRDTPSIRVAVLTGAGRGFCAGDDMKESDPRDGAYPPEKEVEIVWHNIVRELRQLPKPVIAAVNGVAVGAGSGLVLGCDIRIASEDARFGDIFIRRGIAGGSYLLTHTVGVAKALELILTGDIIDAQEAARLGIFNKVVAPHELTATAIQLARRLADGPAYAMALSKAAVNAVVTMDLDEGLRREEASKLESLKSAEVREGIMAFVDKRPAKF
jgi:2-(1,2-epoxy-1,2-dihydrophenyl)acetyl-CoA isomerase